MAKFITDLLTEINETPESISKYKDSPALKLIFENAFIPENKFLLPEGTPPFKEDGAPLGMSPANLYQELRRLYIFRRDDLTDSRRQALFINLLEALHPSEAKLIIAIKDQTLTELYPNITKELVTNYQFIPGEITDPNLKPLYQPPVNPTKRKVRQPKRPQQTDGSLAIMGELKERGVDIQIQVPDSVISYPLQKDSSPNETKV